MRIVHIIWALNIGGSESMLVDIINEQSKREETHLIIINNIESISLIEKIKKDVQIHRINRKPGSKNIFKAIKLNLIIRDLKPDIIHCHTQDIINIMPIIRLIQSNIILTIHSTNNPTKNLIKYKKLYAISETVKRDICNRSKLNPIVVSNGIHTDAFIQKKYYSHNNCFKIVQIGRLDHRLKGQDILLQAIKKLVYTKKIQNISVDFIGDGPSANYLKNLSFDLGISTYCNFCGFQNRAWIYNNLCKYDLLVQPSKNEGFGLTVAEAMAAKLPVLVSNIDGPMEIIKDGKYGYFFNSQDYKDLAEKIIAIITDSNSHNFFNKINEGFSHVVDLYDIKKTSLKYIRHYKEFLK